MKTRSRVLRTVALAAAGAAIALAVRECGAPGRRPLAPPDGSVAPAEGTPAAGSAPARDGRDPAALALAPPPSTGWETEAEALAGDLRRILDGNPRAGAWAEARAEAARADLALFPPDRAQVRRLLLGSERDRLLALAALSARPDLDDDLLRIVLRSQRPDDDEVVRLLGAELAAAAPPELAARAEDDLLRAFEGEPNPLVLAVALPALERMDEGRLRALLRTQLAAASPEMLPVLLGLARARLGAAALEELAGTLGDAGGAR